MPYIDIDFTNNGKINPIKEILLGAKNTASELSVSTFLETISIENVLISKSQVSYK